MNQFSQHNKKTQNKIPQRITIKSKYFGQYEPQLFIASRSKSKSRSTSKDDLNKFLLKQSEHNSKISKLNAENSLVSNNLNSVNPQTAKSPKSFNSGSLSEYLLSRSASPGRKKEGSAIEKIIEWIERRYNEKIMNEKIQKGTSLSTLRENKNLSRNQEQKFEQSFKKVAYDIYILKRLKTIKTIPMKISYEKTKQHDIDNINISPIKSNTKAEDFDIYKFKNNQNYSTAHNLFPISELSIENINRSGIKNTATQNLPQKQGYFYKQKNIQIIPTANSLQTSYFNDNELNSNKKEIKNANLTPNNKFFFVQTARSTSTNQILEISKNSFFSNSQSDKDKSSTQKYILKNLPLSEKQLKKSITIQGGYEPQYQCKIESKRGNYDGLKLASMLSLHLEKKLKNQTTLCQVDYWPNALFHPQRVTQVLQPIETNTLNAVTEQDEQILNQIFQMNDNQQHIFNTLKSKNNSIQQSFKNESKPQVINKIESIIGKVQVTQNRVDGNKNKNPLVQNYFSLHLGSNESQPTQIRTYQMPLVKANTNFMLKTSEDNPTSSYASRNLLVQNKSPNKEVFTFNSLNPQTKEKPQAVKQKVIFQTKKPQNNAFVQKRNLFGLCGAQNAKELQRSNYFTDVSTSGRDRGTSCNSNQSKKTSSKPKVNFNYVSPSSKNIPVLTKEKQQENSVLFKSQSSHLKNYNQPPIQIEIKTSRQTRKKEQKEQENVKNMNFSKKEISPQAQNRQIKSHTLLIDQKQRSQSVPHFIVQKPAQQQPKPQHPTQYKKITTQNNIQTKNAFVSAGYGPSYYQSQKAFPSPQQIQATNIQPNYQSVQSYYFPGMISSHMAITQVTHKIQPQIPVNVLKKESQGISRKDHRFLYPIQNSVQKQRTQRAKSLCQKIFVTVKKGKC